METVKPLIIALDGRSGAGKSSLAAALAAAWGPERVSILHLEDLYYGWDSLQETCTRYAVLLRRIRAGQPVSWPRWDWQANAPAAEHIHFTPSEIVLVEGVGALCAEAVPEIDLGIWLQAGATVRRERALRRDGEVFARHWARWAAQEQDYLSAADPAATANVHLRSDAPDEDAALHQLRRLARFLPARVRVKLPATWLRAAVRHERELPVPGDVAAVFESLAEHCRQAALLESTSHRLQDPLGRNRYTVLALAQEPEAALLSATAQGTELRSGNAMLRLGPEFFAALGGIWPSATGPGAEPDPAAEPPAPDPQWVGYLGYELKREVGAADVAARLPDGSLRPDAQFFEPDTVLIVDHLRARLTVRALGHLLEPTLARLQRLQLKVREPGPLPVPVFSCRDTPEQYRDKVRRAQHEIWQGNSYEVCLTTELRATVEHFSAFEAYSRLRESSPAPFAHYLRLGSLEVASISPERFVSISGTGKLRAEPIKGTRPRGQDPSSDAALREDLASHPKDRAENIMIVDLLRNDLSHHAVPGTLSVTRLCAIESYATVHQMVSTIDAQLREPALAAAALREAFPPGSMTGAPKLSTMHILDRLEENRARGLYSGAVGYLGADGGADLAVVIRTLVCDRLGDGSWQLSLGLGGAITADSDPQEEWDEVRTKSVGVLSALGASFPH